MVDVKVVTKGLSVFVAEQLSKGNTLDWFSRLASPEQVADDLAPALQRDLEAAGVCIDALREQARGEPFIYLPQVVGVQDLPDTPTAWTPVPSTATTLAVMLTIVLLNRLCGMETVSYGSENGGALFVNLVALPGPGAMSEKSKKAMRGHTDAASFPFRGTLDPTDARIAPSPDIVFLAALRNPDQVPTTVTPLVRALDGLSEKHRARLEGRNLTIHSQRSFRLGTKAKLGVEHMVDPANALYNSPEGMWVRYSHANVLCDEDDQATSEAKAVFEDRCAQCAAEVVLRPGDVLLVNNRKALHGRALVGGELGGASRWLLRSYGLDTTDLMEEQRHTSSRHILFP